MKTVRRARATARREFRALWRKHWAANHIEYTWEGLDRADAKIGTSSHTADLPLASLGNGYGGHRSLRKSVNNLCRFFGVLPPEWSEQPTYHKLKPGKPKGKLSSYRELTLCRVELRSGEQLWSGRNSEALWQHAGGTQYGRTDTLFVVYLEIETGRIRMEQGLPDGVFYGDAKEAFDTIPAENIVARMQRIGIQGEDLALGEELLARPWLTVVTGDRYAEAVQPETGVPQGRGTGPPLYACGATEYADCMQNDHQGVGLDPPDEMVQAFHSTKDGSDEMAPDDQLAQELAAAWSSQLTSAGIMMEAAGDDSTRLRLLDILSTTRVCLRQYLDDTARHGSSWGALQQAADDYSAASARLRASISEGVNKTGFQARGFRYLRSLSCAGKEAPHNPKPRESVGVLLDPPLTMMPLLRKVDQRGRGLLRATQTTLEFLGSPSRRSWRRSLSVCSPRCCMARNFSSCVLRRKSHSTACKRPGSDRFWTFRCGSRECS